MSPLLGATPCSSITLRGARARPVFLLPGCALNEDAYTQKLPFLIGCDVSTATPLAGTQHDSTDGEKIQPMRRTRYPKSGHPSTPLYTGTGKKHHSGRISEWDQPHTTSGTHHFFAVERTVVSTFVTKLMSMDTTSSLRDLVASYVSATRFSVSAAMRSVSVPLVPMYCAAHVRAEP